MQKLPRKFSVPALTGLATLWTALAWIGTDMFLPALPSLSSVFDASEATINLIIFAFEVCLALGCIIGGALSDKLGRKAPLLAGGFAYVAFNLASAISPTIEVLIFSRAMAGLGGGFVCAIVMAILKDEISDPQTLDKTITATQSFVAVGPVAAPFLGSLALSVADWRGIFVVLACLSLACFVWSLFLPESLPKEKRLQENVWKSIGTIFKVGKNPSFILVLLILNAGVLTFGVFVTQCSYIFLNTFDLTNFEYSVCYALSGVMTLGAPFVYLFAHRHTKKIKTVVVIITVLLLLSGVLSLTIGQLSPILFLVAVLPFLIAEGMSRPCVYYILLEGETENIGSISALISFVCNMFCSLGVPLASLSIGGTYLSGFAWPTIMASILAFVFFFILTYLVKSDVLNK